LHGRKTNIGRVQPLRRPWPDFTGREHNESISANLVRKGRKTHQSRGRVSWGKIPLAMTDPSDMDHSIGPVCVRLHAVLYSTTSSAGRWIPSLGSSSEARENRHCGRGCIIRTQQQKFSHSGWSGQFNPQGFDLYSFQLCFLGVVTNVKKRTTMRGRSP
jgi:hypothetical protein